MNREKLSSPEFIIPLVCICAILVVIGGGFFPFSYYSVNYSHYYITTLPTEQQKDILCSSDMFKIVSVTNVSSYCCDEYYDVYLYWSHVNIWNYGEQKNAIEDYLKSVGLEIADKCE